MHIDLSKQNYQITILNLLFSTIPLSFIVGNLVLNLNIILFILTSIFFYKKKVFEIKYFFIDKLIIFFFIYVLLNGLGNYLYSHYLLIESEKTVVLTKSILFLRFLLLYFVIKYLIYKKYINFKFFFHVNAFVTIFLCLDLIFQYFYGFDIFGYEGLTRRMSGPFGEEHIAGGYLQRFILFSFFLFPIFFKFKMNGKIYLFFIVMFSIVIFSFIITGNRIPFIMFLITIFSVIIFEKKVKKFLLLFLLITSVITSSAIYFDKDIKNHFVSFKYKTFALINFFDHEIENPKNNFVDKTYITIMDKSYPQTSTHMKELVSGYQTWQLNKYFGGGIKSFRNECPKTQIGILQKNCSPHPHNYYLEILSELGLFGFMIIIIIFLRTIYEIFIKKYFLNSNLKKNLIITPFIFIFLAEIFPLKTTGSFFSSGNATFVFFILAVSITLSRVNIKIKKIIFK